MSEKQTILIRKPDNINITWAQRVVDQNSAGTTVSAVEILSVESGTTTRVHVNVTHNGPTSLPRKWFIKLPSMSLRVKLITALPRLLQTEVRFYREMATSIPLTKPQLLAAESAGVKGITLVLGDVTETGALPGSTDDELTSEEAFLVAEQMAYMHACFWNVKSLDKEYSWLAGPVRQLEDRLGAVLAVPLMKRGLRLAGENIPAKLHAQAIHYASKRSQFMRFLSKGPQTIIHHDCHPGNIFWEQNKPGFLDWQLVRIGEGIGDIAYFLATSLNPATRRAHEMEILERYQETLSITGMTEDNFTQLKERYRAHLCYPFEAMVVTLAIGGMMPLEDNLELIRRTAAAVEDHDAFAVKLE